MRVPEDIAVAGFDDSPIAVASDPEITTMRQPFERISQEMVRLRPTDREITTALGPLIDRAQNAGVMLLTEPLKTTADVPRETPASLWLYNDRHTWTQPTPECLADAVDAGFRGNYDDFEPIDRWWRD